MERVVARPTIVHQPAPVEPGELTAERYLSPEWMAREQAELWSKVWLFACLERDVAEPGQFMVFDIANESILISRSAEGALGAFYNVCQHRGMRLACEPSGCVKSFF